MVTAGRGGAEAEIAYYRRNSAFIHAECHEGLFCRRRLLLEKK
jgi:hypothetical protein